MDAGCGEELGVGLGQHRGHRATGREAGDEDAVRAHAEFGDDLPGDPGEDRGLARVPGLVRRIEPVPAAGDVGRAVCPG